MSSWEQDGLEWVEAAHLLKLSPDLGELLQRELVERDGAGGCAHRGSRRR